MNVAPHVVDTLLRRKILTKPHDCKISSDEEKEILTWRNTLLRQVKCYIDNTLDPAKTNVIDPTKDNFTRPI